MVHYPFPLCQCKRKNASESTGLWRLQRKQSGDCDVLTWLPPLAFGPLFEISESRIAGRHCEWRICCSLCDSSPPPRQEEECWWGWQLANRIPICGQEEGSDATSCSFCVVYSGREFTVTLASGWRDAPKESVWRELWNVYDVAIDSEDTNRFPSCWARRDEGDTLAGAVGSSSFSSKSVLDAAGHVLVMHLLAPDLAHSNAVALGETCAKKKRRIAVIDTRFLGQAQKLSTVPMFSKIAWMLSYALLDAAYSSSATTASRFDGAALVCDELDVCCLLSRLNRYRRTAGSLEQHEKDAATSMNGSQGGAGCCVEALLMLAQWIQAVAMNSQQDVVWFCTAANLAQGASGGGSRNSDLPTEWIHVQMDAVPRAEDLGAALTSGKVSDSSTLLVPMLAVMPELADSARSDSGAGGDDLDLETKRENMLLNFCPCCH